MASLFSRKSNPDPQIAALSARLDKHAQLIHSLEESRNDHKKEVERQLQLINERLSNTASASHNYTTEVANKLTNYYDPQIKQVKHRLDTVEDDVNVLRDRLNAKTNSANRP